MRQVRRSRPANIRTDLKRAQGRKPKRSPAKSFGKREAPPRGFGSRILGGLGVMFSFRRPMLLTVSLSTLLVLIAAVLVSGIVPRTLARIDKSFADEARAAGFAVTRIDISGTARTPKESVRAALGAHPGQSIFDFDIYAARARLKRLPWVQEAEVRRRYPGDLAVRIVEKQPFARWQGKDRIFVVTRAGDPITDQGAETFRALPLLAGDGAPTKADAMLSAVAHHPAVAHRIAVYQYQSERRWNLITAHGVVVKLPEYGWQRQIGDLERLIVHDHILDYDLVEIDMRDKTYLFLRKGASTPEPKKTDDGRAI